MRKLTGVLLTLLTAVLLSGCARGTLPSAASDAPTSRPTLPPRTTATTTPTPTTPPGPPRNSRGNIVKAFGEEGGLTEEINGNTVAIVSFAVDSIAPIAACTEPYYDRQPENGVLIGVQMRFSTAPELAQSSFPYFSVSPYEFTFIGANGVTMGNLSTIATYGCLPDNQLLTSDQMIPGSQYAGLVILDVPEATGTLIYRPSSLTSGGWEWSF